MVKKLFTTNLLAAVIIAAMLLVGTTPLTAGEEAPEKGYLGVSIEKVSKEVKKDLGIDHGVVVIKVTEGEAADKADIKKGDVILSFNGEKIRRPLNLVDAVRDCKPESKAKIVLLRDGKKKEVTAVLGKHKKRKYYSFYVDKDGDKEIIIKGDKGNKKLLKEYFHKAGSGVFLGVFLQTLNEDLAEYFGVKKDEGVLVVQVSKDSPAEKAGVKAGDVIVKIEDKKVTDKGDITKIINKMKKGDKVNLLVVRHKKKKNLNAELEERKGFGKHFIFGDNNHKHMYKFFDSDKNLHAALEDIHISIPDIDWDFNVYIPDVDFDEIKIDEKRQKIIEKKLKKAQEKLKKFEIQLKEKEKQLQKKIEKKIEEKNKETI